MTATFTKTILRQLKSHLPVLSLLWRTFLATSATDAQTKGLYVISVYTTPYDVAQEEPFCQFAEGVRNRPFEDAQVFRQYCNDQWSYVPQTEDFLYQFLLESGAD
jgi:hypothetical protein